jgi:glucose/arabinose dehydrogenase
VSGMSFYRGDLPLWRESLLIAAERGLRRARFNPRTGRIEAIDRVTEGPVRAVAVTDKGEVFVATRDAVLRVPADAAR